MKTQTQITKASRAALVEKDLFAMTGQEKKNQNLSSRAAAATVHVCPGLNDCVPSNQSSAKLEATTKQRRRQRIMNSMKVLSFIS